MTTDATPVKVPERRWSRAAKIALVVSLGLNVLLLGVFAGAIWRHEPGMFGGRGGAANLFGYLRAMPAARRQAVAAEVWEMRKDFRALREEIRRASAERDAALAADPFDRQRFIDAQTRQIEVETRARTMMRDVVAKTADKMTAAERREFSRWRPHRRMGGADDGFDDRPGGPVGKGGQPRQ